MFVECTHILTLNSTAVRAWGECFRDVDVVLPQLKPHIIANARLSLYSDVETLKRNFGNTLLSLSLNRVSIRAREFYPIPGSHLSPPPFGNERAYPRDTGQVDLGW